MIVIRLDAGVGIGSGHAVRCAAIARELAGMGEACQFAVSGYESARFLGGLGLGSVELGGDPLSLGTSDGESLALFAGGVGADTIFVDTYGAGDEFFSALKGSAAEGTTIAYMDDCYTFREGMLARPDKRPVDLVVNYGFAFGEEEYSEVYGGDTRLAVGPSYAPVRDSFRGRPYRVSGEVGQVMVTTGSTNPDASLERMVEGIRLSGLGCKVTVVVGPAASFDETCLVGIDSRVLHDVRDMAAIMLSSDIALSAAGSTLYELCCIGVPTAAFPIVENQLGNVKGLSSRGLGLSSGLGWDAQDVAENLSKLASRPYLRREMSNCMRECVDGRGAERIAIALRYHHL